MVMKPNYSHLFSCIFLIAILNPFQVSSHQHDTKNPSPPPLKTFLNNLIGTRKGNSSTGLFHLKKYLARIGHMATYDNTESSDEDLFDDALELAIRNYQTYFKLPVNGVLDANTVENLSMPRCGVPDNGIRIRGDGVELGASHYTFFPGAPKWPQGKTELTYSFPPGERTDVNTSTLDATNMWSDVSDFRFSYTDDYDRADIKISFVSGNHGDGSPFDGQGGILAHAFAPPDGRLHYDEDEAWVYGVVKDEFDILTVGLHELGHVLGLGHTNDKYAVMYPYIGSGLRKKLGEDDIEGIRALYYTRKNSN